MTDGCVHLLHKLLEIPSARSRTAPVRETGTVRKMPAVRPVHHVQNHTCRVTLLQPVSRATVLGQHSRFRPHWFKQELEELYLRGRIIYLSFHPPVHLVVYLPVHLPVQLLTCCPSFTFLFTSFPPLPSCPLSHQILHLVHISTFHLQIFDWMSTFKSLPSCLLDILPALFLPVAMNCIHPKLSILLWEDRIS